MYLKITVKFNAIKLKLIKNDSADFGHARVKRT